MNPATTEALSQGEPPPRPGSRLSFLLVEDSPLDAELIAARFEDEGLDVDLQRVDTQAAFTEAISECRFDAILSDYNVPGFDGVAALAAARLACPDTPFLFVSGALGEERAIELLKRGATDYVLKDNLGRLVSCVRRALDEARERRERKQAEEEIRQRAEFEQQLIGVVSHDLRNPLNAILLGAASLLRQEGLTDRQTATVARMQASAERAARLIRDLLDFTQARFGGGIPVQPRPCDLHALVRQAADEIEASFPERALRLQHSGEGQGDWDPDRLAQALINLLANAVTYSPEDTEVRVNVQGLEDGVVVDIHNRGEPISAELLPRLFEPMTRGTRVQDRSSRSVGLGLYIVDRIVRAHRGVVHVQSSAQEGTTFSLRLPRRPLP